jgi:hypothetical protein
MPHPDISAPLPEACARQILIDRHQRGVWGWGAPGASAMGR